MRILVAEDEPAVRRLLSQTLQKLGHEVVTVETGRAALEAFARPQVERLTGGGT